MSLSAAPAIPPGRACCACTSSNRRTLPIAITAWSAKVCSRAICLSLKGWTSLTTEADHSNAFVLAQQRNTQDRAMALIARSFLRPPETRYPRRTACRAHAPVSLSMTAHPAVQLRLMGHLSLPARYRPMMRTWLKVVTDLETHDRVIGAAKFAGALDNGLEHRSNIGRRGCDHAEDVAAAGLVYKCLGQVACLGLNLIEQPDILDGDHRLVGKCRRQVRFVSM